MYASPEMLRDIISIGIGHCTVTTTPEGVMWQRPKSISFSNMDQAEFDIFFNSAVDYVCAKIIPGLDNAELTRQVFEMIGSEVSGALSI